MSWLICGTFPDDEVGLLEGIPLLKDSKIILDRKSIPVRKGTPALLAAMLLSSTVLGIESPRVLLAGDAGKGKGSRLIYAHLVGTLEEREFEGITFHSLLPDIDWQVRILENLEKLSKKPLLIADAGYLYAAKMSGSASSYDLFTPSTGELAFLADEEAPHPFYTSGFLLIDESDPQNRVDRAVKGGGAAKALLIKGRRDNIVINGQITVTIDNPCVSALECIGGTGDTLTGIVSALLHSGLPMERACETAAMTNRYMGELAHATPATHVSALIEYLPKALKMAIERTDELPPLTTPKAPEKIYPKNTSAPREQKKAAAVAAPEAKAPTASPSPAEKKAATRAEVEAATASAELFSAIRQDAE